MADALRTGLSGLLAFQNAIATSSHNIANVNTDGYSRQRVDFAARPPQHTPVGYIGQGVGVDQIARLQDRFAQGRLDSATSDASRGALQHELLSRIDTLLAEDSISLSPVLNDFFNAMQDANANPSSTATRQALIGAANNLAHRITTLQGQFDQLEGEINTRLNADVADINSLATQLAVLNREIASSASSHADGASNDLLDQRDRLLGELASHTRISTHFQDNGAVNVFVGSGLGLVIGTEAQSLAVTQDPLQADRQQLSLTTVNGPLFVGNQLSGGSLGGIMEFRERTLDPMMNQLGRLAITLADNLNRAHAGGLDLHGARGEAWFALAAPEVIASTSNSGTAALTASFSDTAQISASDYRLAFDGSDYTLTRLHDGERFSGTLPMRVDGIDFELTGAMGAGDSFIIRPTRKAARAFSPLLNDPSRIALASPLASLAPPSNLGTATISYPTVLDHASPTLDDTVEIRFLSANSYDVINTDTGATLASGVSYTSGDDIAYNGWQLSITGEAAAGDTFEIGSNHQGSENNRNGLALAELQNSLMIGGSSNLQQGYAAMVSQIGSETRQAQINSVALDGLQESARQARERVSGVNLDEEAINLTRYQQAYQAAAQVIATAEDMFQTLIGAVGR